MKIFQTRLHRKSLLLSVIFTLLSFPLTADARKLSGSTGAFAKAAKPPRPTPPPKPPVTKPAPKPPTGGKGDAATPPKATVVAPSASRGAGHVSGAAVGTTVKPGNSLSPDTAKDVIASIAPHTAVNQKPTTGKPLDETGAHLGKDFKTLKPGELYVNTKTGKMRRLSPEGDALINSTPTGNALKTDPHHRSASQMREQAAENGSHFKITGGDGETRTLTQIKGNLNDKSGRYEFIVDNSGKLTHQRFVENGSINGLPNIP